MNAERLLAMLSCVGDDPRHLEQLRKIAVALAVTGKLNSSSASLRPAEIRDAIDRAKEPLSRSKRNRHDAITPEQLPEAFGDPTQFVPLGSLARVEKGRTGIKQACPGQFPLVVTGATRGSCDHYDFEGAAAIIPLVSSTGHGKASLNRLHYQEGRFALGTILAAVFPYDPSLFSPRFLFEYLSAFKNELLVSRMTGTANVTLTVSSIAEVPIPLVSPDAQRKVDELMALCDQLEKSRKTREETRSRLLDALLHEALEPSAD